MHKIIGIPQTPTPTSVSKHLQNLIEEQSPKVQLIEWFLTRHQPKIMPNVGISFGDWLVGYNNVVLAAQKMKLHRPISRSDYHNKLLKLSLDQRREIVDNFTDTIATLIDEIRNPIQIRSRL